MVSRTSEMCKNSVSAIVPIFNEDKTVANVVNTLLKNPLINEVICVNDGSTDKSLIALEPFKNKIHLIDLKTNRGKGFALVEGIKVAKGNVVAFFDADLTNLSNNHIATLLNPVLEGNTRAVLGYPSKGWCVPNIFSHLTGERVYYKEGLIPHLEKIAETRFGVETFLNSSFDEKETKKVPLKQLRGLYKYEKHNTSSAFKEYLNEAVEIAQELGKREGLLPEDYQAVIKLAKVANFEELKNKVREIKNKKLKKFFSEYITSYMKWAKEKMKDLYS